MEEIALSNVRKSYGKAVAVEELNLTIKPGEFLTVLGPSGCGKTTTLRLIAGLEEPDEGEIRIGDTIVFSSDKGILVPPEKRNLGLIFQSYALWPHMTVERNITLALEQKKLSKVQVEERLATALEKVQLTPYRERYPSELSGGQQQRVAVARLIAMQSSILMMDEPLSNLDAMLRTDMRGELKRLHAELDATTVYVTHDQVEALTLSDTIVVMNEGLVQQEAAAHDIYHKPANLFVAEFIGNPRINRFEGTVQDGGDTAVAQFRSFQMRLPEGFKLKGADIIATVRPESIQIAYEPREDWLPVIVDSSLPTGSETILQTHVGETPITVVQPGFFTLKSGHPLWLKIDAGALNYFDPDSGLNLSL